MNQFQFQPNVSTSYPRMAAIKKVTGGTRLNIALVTEAEAKYSPSAFKS